MTTFKWTTELADKALELYVTNNKDNARLEDIATVLGTTTHSIRGKLAIMGEYAKPEKVTKAGGTKSAQTKAETVKAIEIMLSVPAGEFASLDKGSVKSVSALFEALKNLSLVTNGKLGLKES
jgi:hypothetical protein